MKLTLATLLGILLQSQLYGQSPFDYGKNREVYFISTEIRTTLGFDEIYTVYKGDASSQSGKGQNWEITAIAFGGDEISDSWIPVTRDDDFRYNFDSLVNDPPLNGERYYFSQGQLTAHGGEGYGTFDRREILRVSDTVSVTEISCTGHCGGNHPVRYSKNVYSTAGRLLYTVSYPAPEEDAGLSDEGAPVADPEFLMQHATADNLPDTVYYLYNARGLYTGKSGNSLPPGKTTGLFNPADYFNGTFNQCYVGKVEMEKYFKKKLGYAPALVLVEIYRLGVFSFSLNPTDKKYYRTETIVLE